jgi:hypothetical protein
MAICQPVGNFAIWLSGESAIPSEWIDGLMGWPNGMDTGPLLELARLAVGAAEQDRL